MARRYYRKKRAVPIKDNPFWGLSSDALQIKKIEFQRRIVKLISEENIAENHYEQWKSRLQPQLKAQTEWFEKKIRPKADEIFNKLYEQQKSESGKLEFHIIFFSFLVGAFMIVALMSGELKIAVAISGALVFVLVMPVTFAYWHLYEKFVKNVNKREIREQAFQQALELLPPNELQQYQKAKSALDSLGFRYSSPHRGELSELEKKLDMVNSITSKTKDRERKEKLKAFEDRGRQGSSKLKTKLMGNIFFGREDTCPYCEHVTKKDNLVMDHIIPITDGGKTTFQNCVLVCESCNQKKSDMTLRAFCRKMGFDFNMIAEKLEMMGKKV